MLRRVRWSMVTKDSDIVFVPCT